MFITRLKSVAMAAALTMMVAFSTPAMVLAAAPSNSKQSACQALGQLDSSQGCGSSSSKNAVSNIVGIVINILSVIIGIVAVLMIMIAGIKYITSNGDSNSVSSAKSTLTYALIGLVVAALAQFLVHFVLARINGG